MKDLKRLRIFLMASARITRTKSAIETVEVEGISYDT